MGHATRTEELQRGFTDKWKAYLSAGLLVDVSGSSKTVLVCLIDHFNPKTSRCDPSEECIAHETSLPKRTVERAIASLIKTGVISRTRRRHSSNAYRIEWDVLNRVYDRYGENRQNWRITTVKSDGSATVKSGGRNRTVETENRTRNLKGAALRAAPYENASIGKNLRLLEVAIQSDQAIPQAWRDWLDLTEGHLRFDDPLHGWAGRLRDRIA